MEIGQKVKVCRLREKVAPEIIEKAQQGQEAVIRSFKMTDGSSVGVFVEFPDATTSWFFEDEIKVVG
jgi:hypothetical protein